MSAEAADPSTAPLTRYCICVYSFTGLKDDFEGTDNHVSEAEGAASERRRQSPRLSPLLSHAPTHPQWINNVVAFPGRYALHNGYGGEVGTPGNGIKDGHEHRLIGNIVALQIDAGTNYALPVCSGVSRTGDPQNRVRVRAECRCAR